MTRWRMLVVLALAPLAVAACGGDDEPAVSSSPSTAAADRNQADVEFAQGMIPHHEQAIEMADLALTNAESPDVKDLAERITAAQGPEIETMRGWLEDWGEEAPSGMESSMGSGMMSDEEMGDLEAATGEEFDRMFLEMMKEHHESAIEMAQTELDEGENTEAKDLAQAIIDAQQAEIEEIDGLLAAMGSG